MRAKEFLYEDYNERLQSDLTNLIVGAKGSGAQSIQTKQLANELQRMGYSVTVDSLMPLLQGNPAISNASPESIQLSGAQNGNTGDGEGSTQDNAAKVKGLAAKASTL